MAKQEIKHEQVLNVEEAVSRSEAFINKNKKTISTIVIAIVVLIIGGVATSTYIIKPREQKAAEALFVGEKFFQNGNYETALSEFEAVADDLASMMADFILSYSALTFAISTSTSPSRRLMALRAPAAARRVL